MPIHRSRTATPTRLRCTFAIALLLPGQVALAQPAASLVRISDADIVRAGISVTAAVASLDGEAASGGPRYAGTVVTPPASLVMLSSELGGVVQTLHVASLQAVRAGAPVVTLFSQPWLMLQGAYVQAATQAKLAADKLARDDALFNDGIIARARLDDSRAALRLASVAAATERQALRRAGLSAAQIGALARGGNLSPLLVVRAAVAGNILELPVQAGQLLEAGAAIAKIARPAPLWVELQVARQQPMLRIGDRLQIANCSVVRVIAVSPLVNSSNQTLQVRAQQVDQHPCLKVNAYVEAQLAAGAANKGGVAVPAAALVRRGKDEIVFVRTAGGFRAVAVHSEDAGAAMQWVRGAIAAGDQVAVRGTVALKGALSGLGNEATPAPAPAGAN
ncbi:efflux RND transporter periplasmic adaptor subunit [Massilia sp. PWRC2]|uniref:efflux RND transporter periplasmic adaptor subunit n=1 Tax=Massilia sp. PWRC2 TaxID=2804626 RepID=UPI003CEECF76